MTTRVLALILILATTARADHEETEHRLKTAGVGPELRARVHRAITVGVDYLLRRQATDGSFPPGSEKTWHAPDEAAPLVALALRHAGTPRAVKGVRRSLAHLFPRGSRGPDLAHDRVYVTGITLMLLQASGSHREVAVELTTKLANGIDRKTGTWGYDTRPTGPDFPNLSTAQFAGLGLWAGGRLGLPARRAWRMHLDSLLRDQDRRGGWPYWPQVPGNDAGEPWKKDYLTGTFMGIANLLLAEEALKGILRLDEPLRRRTEAARRKGLAALDRDATRFLDGMLDPRRGWALTSFGFQSYYGLYALEKACIFANVETVGGKPWYARGADALCRVQNRDGGWGPVRLDRAGASHSRLVDTAFALLFLLRVSESYHPTTPRPVDSGTATPAAGKAGTPGDPTPPAVSPGRVEIGLARRMLARLRSGLESGSTSNDELIRALGHVGEAYGSLRPDLDEESTPAEFAAAADAWRTATETALLEAVTLHVRGSRGENRRRTVNLAALAQLARVDPRVTTALIRLLDGRRVRDARVRRATFETLADLGRPEALHWLLGRVTTRHRELTRTVAALAAIRSFARLGEGVRIEAARRLVRLFGPVENATDANRRTLWAGLRSEVLATVRHLVRDPATDREPVVDGMVATSLREYDAWLSSR